MTLGTAPRVNVIIDEANRIADTGFGYDANRNLTASPGRSYSYDAANWLMHTEQGGTNKEDYDHSPGVDSR